MITRFTQTADTRNAYFETLESNENRFILTEQLVWQICSKSRIKNMSFILV